jgi:hypothetical protein
LSRSSNVALVLLCLPAIVAAEVDDCANLLDSIRSEFQEANPNIQVVQILDSKPKHTQYWIIARGIAEDWEFKGSFEDELFGVFVVDDEYEKVLKVVDVIPTPRWNDYELWISDYDIENVAVRGHGATYGDHPLAMDYQVRWDQREPHPRGP